MSEKPIVLGGSNGEHLAVELAELVPLNLVTLK